VSAPCSPARLLVPGRAKPVTGLPELVMGRTAGDIPPCTPTHAEVLGNSMLRCVDEGRPSTIPKSINEGAALPGSF